MKSYLLALCSVTIMLFSCKHEKKLTPDVNNGADTTTSNASSSNTEEQHGKFFSGLFVVGRNALSFRECEHADRDFAVVDSTGEMKKLYKTVFLNSPAFPYEYVYVEVRGEVMPVNEAQHLQGYDSVLTVRKVLTFEQKNYQNSCIPYDYWALGNEWSLQISMKEGVLVLKDFSSMMVYVFEYFPPKNMSDQVITYASNNYAMQASIKAIIKKEACNDSANNQFQYSASVLVNGKRYSGCAIKGNSIN